VETSRRWPGAGGAPAPRCHTPGSSTRRSSAGLQVRNEAGGRTTYLHARYGERRGAAITRPSRSAGRTDGPPGHHSGLGLDGDTPSNLVRSTALSPPILAGRAGPSVLAESPRRPSRVRRPEAAGLAHGVPVRTPGGTLGTPAGGVGPRVADVHIVTRLGEGVRPTVPPGPAVRGVEDGRTAGLVTEAPHFRQRYPSGGGLLP
jgi:hypothetical protein